MLRKALVLIGFSLIGFLIQSPAQAAPADTPTIVIMDTGIDMAYAPLKGRVTQEVCILVQKACPNGSDFMEGAGAATLDPKVAAVAMYHGTQMSSIVVKNSTANIIHMRLIGMTAAGARMVSNVSVMERAFQWVVNNRAKYNIGAVSISLAIVNTSSTANYCLPNASLEASIATLKQQGVPTIAAAGNNSNYKNIAFPACINDAIAIGATDPKTVKGEFPALYSNFSNQLDFAMLGKQTAAPISATTTGTTVGTSNATALFTAKWFAVKQANPSFTVTAEYDYFKSNSTVVSTKNVTNVRVVPSS